tara:strand:- start:7202 stop:8038 length:837 start_codon:yes stop_codon:yes gene_type:complete
VNALIICGDHYRNLHLAYAILKTNLVKKYKIIVFKRENIIQSCPKSLTKNQKKNWKIHFAKRLKVENKYFKFNFSKISKNESEIIYIKDINELIKLNKQIKFKKNFEQCYISGLPILNQRLMNLLPIYTINLHLGLIPHFKGALPSIWPNYFFKPHYTGTTYHIIDHYVDTGEIIHQNLAKLNSGFGLHELICSANKAAFDDIKFVLKHIDLRIKKRIKPNKNKTLIIKGKTFKRSDFNPEIYNVIYGYYKDKISEIFLKNNKNYKKPKIISLNRKSK